MKLISNFCSRHPWIYIVMAFALLIGAWTTLITIAVKHTPQQVELNASTPDR